MAIQYLKWRELLITIRLYNAFPRLFVMQMKLEKGKIYIFGSQRDYTRNSVDE